MKEVESVLLKNRWYREIAIFIFLFLVTFLNDREDFSTDHGWIDGFFVFLLVYLHVQVHRFFVLPYAHKTKLWPYAAGTILLIILFTFLAMFIDYYLTNVGWFDEVSENKRDLLRFYFFSFSISVILLLAVFGIYSSYENRIKREQERVYLKDVELKMLKVQSNPHFLFNALHSLYGLSLENPTMLPDKILQLSEIMRYQLRWNDNDFVALEEEIHFLKKYIDFEKDRKAPSIDIQQNIQTVNTSETVKIAPFLLIVFIENAFKHVSPSEKKYYIKVNLKVDGQKLHLKVKNSHTPSHAREDSLHIGLTNAQRRLALIYSNRFSLDIHTSDNTFCIVLDIDKLSDSAPS